MRGTWTAILAVWAAGCGDGGLPAADMALDQAATVDQAAGADLTLRSPIGGPCKATAECGEGKFPVCFAKNLYNKAGYLSTPGGYCTSKCVDDLDCGENSFCMDRGSNGKWCVASCGAPEDCRTGFACWDSGPAPHCWPNQYLDCDPTVGDGTCMTSDNKLGGCWREALGPGKTGECVEMCAPGVGSCTYDNGDRHCVVFDMTSDRDPNGILQGDKFKGPICVYFFADNATGTECKYVDSSGGVHHYLDACNDGDECYTTYFSGGDNKCHTMCDPNLSLPDGGDADAGAAGVCPAGTTCKDAFKLFGSKWPVGLCL
jgi:hypothetical protein